LVSHSRRKRTPDKVSSKYICSYYGEYPNDIIAEFVNELGISPLVARALIRKGITRIDDAKLFLHPHEGPFYESSSLPDIKIAVERIKQAINRNEKICVFGDYDADGVCATAILVDCLRSLGVHTTFYIPSRHGEGYGMNIAALADIISQGITLIITVDNGIAALDCAEYCKEQGIDLIVTDHHIPGEALPAAIAVVAASRRDSQYPNPHLCGAGVAYKLALALNDELDKPFWIALAAVATIADVVPLLDENRCIVARGLTHISNVVGFSALLVSAGAEDKGLDSEAIAFTLAPRLNAAGRMGDASRAVILLLEQNPYRAHELAVELENENRARRNEEARIISEIDACYDDEHLKNVRSIVLYGRDWHLGVIGIVASRLCEKYHKPVILFAERNGLLVGSGRSTDSINLYELLKRFSSRFVQFGGHAGAAGITMTEEMFSGFCSDIETYLQENYTEDDFSKNFIFDEDVSLRSLDLPSVRSLNLLKPFGEANSIPVFRLLDSEFRDVRQIGSQSAHLSATVLQDRIRIRTVGFHLGSEAAALCSTDKFTVLANTNINDFGGREHVELQLIDAASNNTVKLFRAFLEHLLYNRYVNYDKLCEEFVLTHGRHTLATVETRIEVMRTQFVCLRERLKTYGITLESVFSWNDSQLLFPLCVFLELGFLAFEPDSKRICLVMRPKQRDLMESNAYRSILKYVQE